MGANGVGITGGAPMADLERFAVLASGATDADIADALARNAANAHAYDASWGRPPLHGGVLYGRSEAPHSFRAAVAVAAGPVLGPGGLGSVYLKAAGHWAPAGAGPDGTNGVRGVNTIAALNADGRCPCHAEEAPCLLVAAPSHDAGGRRPRSLAPRPPPPPRGRARVDRASRARGGADVVARRRRGPRPTDPAVSPIEVARRALADPDVRFAEPEWWTKRSLD